MRSETGAHATYRQLLARPEVLALARQFGLAQGVRYELVGERRSFHGKAQTANGAHLVRLPSNARPEAYLLLTLLHEWAHLLVHKRSLARRQAPHGASWRREYLAVVQAAARAGLFPGNEEEVLRHAAAGEATTQRAQLRGPDGELLIAASEPPRARFAAGDVVCFLARGGERITGTIRRVNARSYTIATADGTRIYRVPLEYRWIEAAGAPMPSAPAPSPWRVGMRVRFPDPSGRMLTGSVVRVNPKTLTIDASDAMRYRVGYGYAGLRAEEA